MSLSASDFGDAWLRFLERVERQTIGFAEHAARLAGQGRHLKRGLLHGPAFALAQSLSPCTVVLEDVDLVAEERTYGAPPTACCSSC